MVWRTILTALLFILTFGCGSSSTRPHPTLALAPASDLGPAVVNETPEAVLLRSCAENVARLIEDVIALAGQIELEIERLERSDLGVSPGFMRELYGSCSDNAVRLADSFSNCAFWAASQNSEEVFGLWGEVEGVKSLCEFDLKSARDY